MPELTWFAWALLGVAAIVVGLSKTAVPGAGTVAVAIFAAVLPAKQSTGTLLLLLIVADIFAVLTYRRHTNWRALLRLAPAVVAGILLGVAFLFFADDAWVKPSDRRDPARGDRDHAVPAADGAPVADDGPHRVAAATYGTLGGFTTMVANAAGPVMSMYFLRRGSR